jgi:transposase
MVSIIPKLRFTVKQRLLKQLRQCRPAVLRLRYLIIINLDNGRSARHTAAVLRVHPTTVYRVAQRFRDYGEWGLYDGRADNGRTKLDERYLDTLYQVVRSQPPRYGWRRPTWTREMLVATLADATGVWVHVATMSRALALIHARRGRPRPTVDCPWAPADKIRRLNAIRRLLATLPAGHAAVYVDEVDIHLNPKIGLDWMVRGQQKQVVTPGQNAKRYLAGALEIHSSEVVWVEGERKTSALFIKLLDELLRFVYPRVQVLHVVLDNYRIHKSQITQAAVRSWGGRVRLHFLPPYCPLENRIERVWQDLHANVTRNHTCPTIDLLLAEVCAYLQRRNEMLSTVKQRKAS